MKNRSVENRYKAPTFSLYLAGLAELKRYLSVGRRFNLLTSGRPLLVFGNKASFSAMMPR